MTTSNTYKDNIENQGFTIINDIFSKEEIQKLIDIIDKSVDNSPNFRKDNALFAIRNFLNEVPDIQPFIWTNGFKSLINNTLGKNYFLVKAIYFDKPPMSNWLVAWHQDTQISVDRKMDIEGFSAWSVKQGLPSVQPSQEILDDIYTIRIHLEDCDATNGALKVVPKSHTLGILSDEKVLKLEKKEVLCAVKKGGVLMMKPLLLHASSKSTSPNNRRVIHLEFCSKELHTGLAWRERIN
jgi:hypothetical protein